MSTFAAVPRPWVVGPVIAAIVAGLALWAGMSWAKAQVAERLATRLGVPVEVDEIKFGMVEQRISGIRIGGVAHAIDMRVDRVNLRAGLFSLISSGRSAIESVHVEGLRGSLQSHRLEQASKSATGGADAGAQRPAAAVGTPAVSVHRFDLKLSDAEGDIATIEGDSLSFKAGVLHVSAKEVGLRDIGLRVTALGIEAEGERTPEGPRLRGGSVQSLRGESLPAEGSFSRLPRLRAALRNLRASRGVAKGAATSPAAVPDAAPGARDLLSAILAPDGRVQISKAEFGVYRAGQLEPLLKNAQMTLGRTDDGRLKGSGQGMSGSGGGVRWDALVAMNPLSVRADVEVDKLPLTLLSGLVPRLPWYEPEQGQISANLRLRTDSASRVSWEGELHVDGAGLDSPRIAPVPVTDVAFTLSGQGALLPLARRLEVKEGRLQVGAAFVDVAGHVAVKDGEYSVELDATLPATDCGDAVFAIPAGLLGDLSSARFRGKLGGRVELKLDSTALPKTVLEMEVRDKCDFIDMTAHADLRRFRMPFHHTVVEPDGGIFQMDTGPGTTAFTYLEDISPFLVHAVLAHEDTRFFTHGGFSPPHIRNAVVRNLQEGRYVVGASTITMQLVKNLLLHREKTLARKVQEVILTWYVERVMDKREILELYLNVIEYGPSIYGIRHAAQHYFKRLPSELSPAEAAFFATILPAPKRYHEYHERGALPPHVTERVRSLVRRLGDRGSYDDAAVAYGLSELANFNFVKDGQLPPPRQVLGTSAALPYQSGFWSDAEWDLTTTNQAFEGRSGYPE